MRIIQIGNLEPPHSTENHLREAMLALGHEVTDCQEQSGPAWRSAFDALPGCDVVIWTRTASLNRQVPLNVQVKFIEQCNRIGVPIFGVHLDRWWGLARERDLTDPYFRRLDILFTADGGHQAEWESIGCKHIWLPPAVSHVEADRIGRWREEMFAPIAFVGSWQDYHPEWKQRRVLIDHLISKYGSQDMLRLWPERGQDAIRGQALCDLYESTCIVVGDSCLSPKHDGSPMTHYWSDRIPETLGRGGFLLHPYVEGIEDHYCDDIHLSLYRDMGQLDELIDHFLANDDARVQIAQLGQAHVRQHHTYLNRMKEVLAHV